MSNIMLSIIVPIYNTEKYLEKCVESILDQVYESYEIILVDDGSTDSSVKICDEYEKKGRVKVVHKENGGIISARKAGIAVAEGKYIGFVDSDDWIEKNMYLQLMQNVLGYNADIVSCGYYLDYKDTRRIVNTYEEKKVLGNVSENASFINGILATGFDWKNSRNIAPTVCNKVFRKKLLEQVYKNIDERILWDEDTVTVLEAVLDCKYMVLIPDPLYHYRQNTSSVSHRTNMAVLRNYVYVFDELYRISKEHGGILDDQIPYFSLTAARTILEVGFGVESSKHFAFPFNIIESGKIIVIYGAGRVGRCYYRDLVALNYASKVYITDSDPQKWSGEVSRPEEVLNQKYDIMLIAVENENTANKIKFLMMEKGVPKDKLIWQKPIMVDDTYTFYLSQLN